MFDAAGKASDQVETLRGATVASDGATQHWIETWTYGAAGWQTATDLIESVASAIDDVTSAANSAADAVDNLGAQLDAAMGGAASGRGSRGGAGGAMGT